jgi:hypothetical protein
MKSKKTKLNLTDRRRAIEVLRHLHKVGRPLAECADPRRLRIDPKTMLDLCREAALVFPDEREFAKAHDL